MDFDTSASTCIPSHLNRSAVILTFDLRIFPVSYIETAQEIHEISWCKMNKETNVAHGQPVVLRGGLAVGHWTCDLQVAGSIPAGPLSSNIGQLSLASLRGR